MVRDMNFFWEKKISQIIFYRHAELSSLLTENDWHITLMKNNMDSVVFDKAYFRSPNT